MKKFFLFAGLVAALMVSGVAASAQAVSEKAIEKDARKQAKMLVKEGWVTAPGKPSVEMQQLRALKIQNTFDDNFNPKFVEGSAQAVGPNYDAVKFQATELAKIDIAGKIASELAGIVETNIGNTQMDPGQAVAIARTIGDYKSFVAAKLTNIISVVDMYKQGGKNQNVTVQIGLFYNKEEAMKAGMQAVREEMMKESKELGAELDALLGIKK